MLVADPSAAAAWHQFRQEFADAPPERRREMLRRRADQSRRTDLQMVNRAGLGHVGGDLSVLDILTTLFFAVLRVDPEKPDWSDRDRFVLSKGHTAGALYTTLAAAGFFAEEELRHFAAPLLAAERAPQPDEGPRRRDQHRAARARPSRSRSAWPSRRAWPARTATSTWCSATANCRRAATGRPR